ADLPEIPPLPTPPVQLILPRTVAVQKFLGSPEVVHFDGLHNEIHIGRVSQSHDARALLTFARGAGLGGQALLVGFATLLLLTITGRLGHPLRLLGLESLPSANPYPEHQSNHNCR